MVVLVVVSYTVLPGLGIAPNESAVDAILGDTTRRNGIEL